MSTPHALNLSVVLVTPDRCETVRTAVRHLVAQTVRDQIELVLVTPHAAALQPDQPESQRFGAFQIVEIEESRSIARANPAGTAAGR
jgi:hypothetical protein